MILLLLFIGLVLLVAIDVPIAIALGAATMVAVLLTSGTAQTAPPFIPTIIGVAGQDWPAVVAGATLFLLPVMVFTILLRKHLLRGITFGAVRK